MGEKQPVVGAAWNLEANEFLTALGWHQPMLVTKAHKILLDTTPEIERRLISWCGAARWSYNYG